MKLIALDVDGTLVDDDKKISPRTKHALIEAMKAGHKVCIASGRSFYGTEYYAKELEFDKYGGILSNFNGAKITEYGSNKVLFDHLLDLDLVKEVLAFIKPLNISYMIYHGDHIYIEDINTYSLEEAMRFNKIGYILDEDLAENIDFRPNNILFAADPDKIKADADLIYEKFKDRGYLTYSGPHYYELMPTGITKGTSILEIADYFGIDHKDTIAFGDQMNDQDMIIKAGVGVAMGNATEDLKREADYVTLTNNEDGVADYIERFIL